MSKKYLFMVKGDEGKDEVEKGKKTRKLIHAPKQSDIGGIALL